MALPPPIAITTSHRSSRANSAPSRVRSMVGSPGTRNGITASAVDCNLASSPAARSPLAPVTSSTRCPNCAAAGAACATAPSPNKIRPEVANSKDMPAALPVRVRRVDRRVVLPGARLGQHFGHLGHPGIVVWSLLMAGLRGAIPVNLQQHELRRIVCLLDEVETHHPRLLAAVGGVFDGGGFKSFELVLFDVNVHVEYQHAQHHDTRENTGVELFVPVGCRRRLPQLVIRLVEQFL